MNTYHPTQMLRDNVTLAIEASRKHTEDLRAFAALLEKVQGANAPTGECKKLLNYYGFCVLTRGQVHSIAGMLAVHIEGTDFETHEERDMAEQLLQAVEKEAASTLRNGFSGRVR